MGKRKKVKIVNTEIPLPEPVIQHIQSFLNGKEVAQTSAVSKSWYGAWLTHPDLSFDQWDFGMRRISDSNSGRANRFWDFVKNTIQRYEDLNLKVESFKLHLLRTDADSMSVASKLIGKILQLGVVDISLACHDFPREFVLPYEVLAAETLVKLTLIRLNIYLPPGTMVSCSKVKSLNLRGVFIGEDHFFHSFPSLDDLILESCFGLIKLNCPSVKSITVKRMYTGNNFFSGSFPCLENLTLESCHGFVTSNCSSAKVLRLRDMSLRSDFISKFHHLEDLTLESCLCYSELEISSSSLLTISFFEMHNLRAKFNVPSIRKFVISGSYFPTKLPLLSFTAVPKEWESDVSLHMYGGSLKHPWCYLLRRFIKKFSLSKVSLSINFHDHINMINDEEFKGKQGPIVENFTLQHPSSFSVNSGVLHGLLWSFRPKFITQDWFPSSSRGDKEKTSNELLKLLVRELIQLRKDRQSQYPIMSAYHDLGDVNIEYFDVSIAGWRPLRWRTLLSASKSPKTTQKIRFQLEWRGK